MHVTKTISIPTNNNYHKKFNFLFTRHYNGNDEKVMKKIGRWIVKNEEDKTSWFPKSKKRRCASILFGIYHSFYALFTS